MLRLFKTKHLGILLPQMIFITFMVSCSSTTTLETINSTINTLTPPPTITQILSSPTITPEPSSIPSEEHTATLSPTRTSTQTPEGYYGQIIIGLPYSALNNFGCGGYTLYTMDYDNSAGNAVNYWEAYPEFPLPKGFTFSTRDGRRALDLCTRDGFPIKYQLEEGRITQNREDGVLDILITKGIGMGLTLTHGHVNPDVDPNQPGDQILEVGTIVHFGDIIAFTGRRGISSGSDSSLQVGLLDRNGYIPEQELMLIGSDGQPNILYDE